MTNQGKNAIDTVLAERLKELSESRPLEKITIKEITDKAGVIRPPFYNHFQDKYELLEWIITTELLEPIQPLIKAGMVTESMVLMFTNIEKDKKFYAKAVKLEGPVTFHSIAMKCAKKVLLAIIDEHATGQSKHEWLTPDVIATYYAQSMCFVTEGWINQGMTIPAREMAEAYNYIITRSMVDILNEV